MTITTITTEIGLKLTAVKSSFKCLLNLILSLSFFLSCLVHFKSTWSEPALKSTHRIASYHTVANMYTANYCHLALSNLMELMGRVQLNWDAHTYLQTSSTGCWTEKMLRGRGHHSHNIKGVYTKVSFYRDWIQAETGL